MRSAVLVALFTMATPAFAQTSWFQVHGFLTARGVSVDTRPSWTQHDFGKFDVGSGAPGHRSSDDVELAQLGFDFTPASWFLVHADGIARHEPNGTTGERAGAVQAYADLFTDKFRFRAGAFWLPTSRENVDEMWNSRYTITYSALNSWIAQEVRPIGADLQFSPNFYITAGATAFRGLDTMGTALANRGFTFSSRLSVYNEEIALPPPNEVTRPIHWEGGGNIGWSGRLRLQVPEQGLIQFAHVDNRTEIYPGKPPDVPWNTRFNLVSGEVGSTSPSTMAAEWLDGRTAVAFPGGQFTMDFQTWYVLASQKSGKERFTTRYERFSTRPHNPAAGNSHRENGHGLTIAWLHEFSGHVRAGLEYEHVNGERPVLQNPNIGGSTYTVELRYGF